MPLWDQDRNIEVSKDQFSKLLKIGGNAATYCHTTVKTEVTIEKHDPDSLKEEPLQDLEDPVNFETSPTSSFTLGEETLISVSQLNDGHQKQEVGPLAFSSVQVGQDISETVKLLALAAEGLRMRLKPNWICLVEEDGIHTMQLSRNFEKCVQQRIFFRRNGEVHLSVHCVPIPISNFLPSQNGEASDPA